MKLASEAVERAGQALIQQSCDGTLADICPDSVHVRCSAVRVTHAAPQQLRDDSSHQLDSVPEDSLVGLAAWCMCFLVRRVHADVPRPRFQVTTYRSGPLSSWAMAWER
jgi:hypothetical protein